MVSSARHLRASVTLQSSRQGGRAGFKDRRPASHHLQTSRSLSSGASPKSFALCSRTRAAEDDGVSSVAGDETTFVNNVAVFSGQQPEETFHSVTDILEEMRAESASGEADVFIFEDGADDEDDWIQRHLSSRKWEPEELAEDGTILNPRVTLDEEALTTKEDLIDHQESAYSANKGFKEMTIRELNETLGSDEGKPLVLDVRTFPEYAHGHVPGAMNIPLEELSTAAREGALQGREEDSFAVICQSGQRSMQATVRLTKVLGFQNVTNVAGGTTGWIQAGFQVDKIEGNCGSGCGCNK